MAKLRYVRSRRRQHADTRPTATTHAGWLERRSLIHHAEFRKLWAAETISQCGTQISLVALPLMAALLLDASPFQMGLLGAAGTAPFLLIGLVVGVWVDRVRRRPLLIVADVVRAGLLLAIPIAWLFDVLSLELLYAVAFLVGAASVVFDLSYVSFVPSVVRRDQLIEANGKLEMSASTAQVAGPAAGGTLVGLLSGPVAILLDAVSYLVSAWFLLRMQVGETVGGSRDARPRVHTEILDGIRLVVGNRTLFAIATSTATVNLFGQMFLAVYILYMTGPLGLGATAVGLVLALGGVGALIGAAGAERVSHRIGIGPAIVWARLLFGVGGMLVPIAISVPAFALPLVLASEFFVWMVLVVGAVNSVSLRQSITPDRLLGRVSATSRFLGSVAMPIGALLGGLLGEVIGVRATLVVSSFGMLTAAAWFIGSPVWSLKRASEVTMLDTPAVAAFD